MLELAKWLMEQMSSEAALALNQVIARRFSCDCCSTDKVKKTSRKLNHEIPNDALI